jgi:hypothetical protein
MTFRFKSNIAKLFVLAVLLSAVASSELPELARLMDNTSNDFTSPSYLMGEIGSAVTAQVTATGPVSSITPGQKLWDVPQQPGVFRSSRNLLLLYSILRT